MRSLSTSILLLLAFWSSGSTGCDGPVASICDDLEDVPSALGVILVDLEGNLVTAGDVVLDAPLRRGEPVFGTYRLEDEGVTPNREGRLRAQIVEG
ncbi:hypothetical protein, partial [Rubrivirga sp.]|uniref:hypothetical protein n=1 Tax=Rubrivirga sp. TaxID=1885344 RepID=UPI003C7828F0